MLETRREKIVVGGGTAAIALLLYVLWSGGEASPEPAGSPPAQAAAPRPAPPPPPAPPRAAPADAAAAATPPAQPAAPGEGLTLHGVLGGGRTGSAIIGGADGSQRLVLAGREAAPGLVLRDILIDRVVLSGASGDVVLRLGGQSLAGGGAATPLSAAGSAVPTTPAQQRAEARRFRAGLEPRRVGGRTTGYAIRPNASLPLLQRAGLRPGDVLVSVNGQSFDSDERVLDLPLEIAGSYTAEFEFERNGRRMRASLPVTPR